MISGHVMLDLQGLELDQMEREILAHPQVGGVILFSRNYESKKQITHLTESIRTMAPHCLIAVDQEGGRVQRFKQGFQRLPCFKEFGVLFEENPQQALLEAEHTAYAMAKELLEVGVDISFTPVLDIDSGKSEVIGDRSFHPTSDIVIKLGRNFIKGMHKAGMPATGKHFPGHGSVAADSHKTLPVDSRQFEEIFLQDLRPFYELRRELDAIMPAHILYESIDGQPTCFSDFWLQEVLRSRLNFEGVIFSDDLSMAGAECAGDYIERAQKALGAGCDMILVCNQQSEAIRVLEALEDYKNPLSQMRLTNFKITVN